MYERVVKGASNKCTHGLTTGGLILKPTRRDVPQFAMQPVADKCRALLPGPSVSRKKAANPDATAAIP